VVASFLLLRDSLFVATPDAIAHVVALPERLVDAHSQTTLTSKQNTPDVVRLDDTWMRTSAALDAW